MSESLKEVLDKDFRYRLSLIHTAFPAVVQKYDKETRRADVQPSLKRCLPDGTYVELPVLVDCPVIYFGTKKGGIHIPLEEGDEVLVICSERCIDSWKDNGGKGIEDKDFRKFSISDAMVIPGLQGIEFPNIEDKDGFSIYHDDGIIIKTSNGKIEMANNGDVIINEHLKVTK